MLVKKDIKRWLHQLSEGEVASFDFEGTRLFVKMIDETSKFSITALIFEGEDYIPRSVRHCVSHPSPFFHPSLLTHLTVEESLSQVRLHYLGRADSMREENLVDLLQDFADIAEKWRLYLDEHGKNDLIHVRVKR